MGRPDRKESKKSLISMAKKPTWKKKIKAACEEAGTYEPFFDIVIDQLAGIMETRDTAADMFKKMGGKPVISHTNKGGNTNLVKNPALVVINDCNQQALAYWRDLGLTPSGFKKLSGKEIENKEATFEDVLAGIGI